MTNEVWFLIGLSLLGFSVIKQEKRSKLHAFTLLQLAFLSGEVPNGIFHLVGICFNNAKEIDMILSFHFLSPNAHQ